MEDDHATPSRRAVLAGVGAVGSATLAGCLGSLGLGSDSGEREYEVRVLDDPTNFEGVPVPDPPDADLGPPALAVTVGRREDVSEPDDVKRRDVECWNDADRERSLSVSVFEGETELLARDATIPAGRTAAIGLLEPGDYRIAFEMDGTTVTVERSSADFDCNDYATVVRVGPDGETERSTVATELACT